MEPRQTVKERPIIGLALGGGGARGYAHLGVIKALQEANIPVDVIAGTSIGAIIGAVYASECSVDKAEDIATNIQWRQLLHLADLTLPSRGVIAGDRVEQYLNTLITERDFDQLQKDLVIVATDISTGETIYLKDGPVARAVRASIAIPGIFCPIEYEGRLLVDGTITAPVPVKAVKDLGAELIVAVDVSSSIDRAEIFIQALKWWKELPSRQVYRRFGSLDLSRVLGPIVPESIHIVSRSLELNDRYVRTPSHLTPPMHHLVIRPAVDNVRWYEFHRATECIQAGEVAGRQMVEQIREILEHAVDLPNEPVIKTVVNL
ncbi:MAG: patatin-like phospholipase family protein [Bacillota bacterium]|nr:patatin-like phospholipase family protein [Bacillota bacterium]